MWPARRTLGNLHDLDHLRACEYRWKGYKQTWWDQDMRLTKFSDYSLRVLMYAANKGGNLATIEATAEVFGISRSHLKKVVLLLIREGFLRGHRGRAGGFTLALAPEEINLGQVLRMTEPDFGMVECFLPDNRCHITRQCRLPRIINDALSSFLATFDRYTLADVLLDERSFLVTDGEIQPQRGPHLSRDGREEPTAQHHLGAIHAAKGHQ